MKNVLVTYYEFRKEGNEIDNHCISPLKQASESYKGLKTDIQPNPRAQSELKQIKSDLFTVKF